MIAYNMPFIMYAIESNSHFFCSSTFLDDLN